MNYIRCRRCLWPSNIPGMKFKNGLCGFCTDGKKVEKPHEDQEKRLEKILQKAKGKKRSYDCVIGLSGGKDSTYALFLLKKKYGMNPLAINFDNGFRSDEAVKNIEQVVNKLGVDLFVFRPDRNRINQLYKTFLLNAGEFCTPCLMLIDTVAENLALRYKIPLIISGAVSRYKTSWHTISPASYYDRTYYRNVIKNKIDFSSVREYIKSSYIKKGLLRLIGTYPIVINLMDYIDYSIMEVLDVLKNEIGWTQPMGEIEHGDCIVDRIKDYIIYLKYGCSEKTGLYSALVRNGEITREEGLKKLEEEEIRNVPKVFPEFLEKLGISEKEFYEAVKVDFRNIPNISHNFIFKSAKNTVNCIQRMMGKK